MEEVKLTVNEEVDEFLQNERPLWPYAPTACVVTECDPARQYSSFRDFMDHWKDKHIDTKTYYKCLNCRQLYGTNKHKKAHEKSKLHKGETVKMELITKSNDKFIAPKGKLPYQLGSKGFRSNMRELQKQMAKAKRKLDAAEWSVNQQSDYSPEELTHQVCRDERIVERQGVLYKDTNLWDSPRRRKRVKIN